MYLTGRTDNRLTVMNAVEMKMSNEWNTYIKHLFTVSTFADGETGENAVRFAVSKEKNCDLYAIILDKYNSGIYSNRPNPIGRMLKDGQAKFENLSLDKQAYVLKQLVQLSLNSNQGADLRDLGGSSSTGTTKFSKNIESHNEFLLISMSPTGLYKSETNLLTV